MFDVVFKWVLSMKKSVALLIFMSSAATADTFKEAYYFGARDRCSFMCEAFRANASGMCMNRGFLSGSAVEPCACDENNNPPFAYGEVSCNGSLGDSAYGNIMKLPLNGKRCSEMAPVFEFQISAKCRERGFKTGRFVSPAIYCSEAGNTQWAIASVICEGKDTGF